MKALLPPIAILLLSACSGSAPDEAATADPVAQVRTAAAELGASTDEITAYGVTEADPGSGRTLVAPAEALIAKVDAPTGTAVTRGQAVITLAPSPATRSEIARATSDAVAAQAAYLRAQRLRTDGLVSDADVETARAAAQTAQAARANLGIVGNGLTLRAPIPGTVQGLTAKPGDQITAGTTLATVAAPGDLRARFGIDPAIAQHIRPGQTIRIEPVNGGSPLAATIVGVDSQVDPATRLIAIFVRVPAALRGAAGEPLRAALSVSATANGITIPYSALLDDGGRSYVFIVASGVAKARDVSPGGSTGDRIRILKGLKPGERVVTEGGTALEDGMKVREGAAK